MPKIGFCCTWPATDPNANSGYAFSIRKQLLQRYQVVDLLLAPRWPSIAFAGFKVGAWLRRRRYGYEREPLYLDALARDVERWAGEEALDAIVCPTTIPVTRYRGKTPVVVVTDQVFPTALEGYLWDATPRYRHYGMLQEREALARCAAVSFPSHDAAEAAMRCGADPRSVHVIEWGANLLAEPSREDVRRAVHTRPGDVCSLVFIGREWKRKGGDIVVAMLAELRSRGVPARLTIVGTTPGGPLPDGVRVIPFLDKQTPSGAKEFAELMTAAFLLVMPSRAEAWGHVYCEAAAFGVPSVAAAVGGIPSLIRHGETGILVDPSATPAGIAGYVAALWSDRAAYQTMAMTARGEYEQRLNWNRFGERFSALVDSVIR